VSSTFLRTHDLSEHYRAHRRAGDSVRRTLENRARLPDHRRTLYNGLIKKVDTLRRHPTRCPLAAENDKFPEEIRELLYGRSKRHKHRIIFTLRADNVHILYVRHSACDEL
jgi:hypothetical protein